MVSTAMTETILAGNDFDHDTARAKRAAADGPVIITEAGQPAYVLLRHEDYARLAARKPTIVELLRMDGGGDDFDFDPPKLDIRFKPVDFD
jgi:prevent-host-death family protein